MTESEARKVDAEIAKLIAESARLNAETKKIAIENVIYPFAMVVGTFGGIAALITAIFGAIRLLS